MPIIKVDNEKVKALAWDIRKAIMIHLEKTNMTAAEIQLALTQVIYHIGRAAVRNEQEKALRVKERVAA